MRTSLLAVGVWCASCGDGPTAPTSSQDILFDMSVGGNRDIYRATIGDTVVERLTTDPGADVHPTAAKGVLVFTSYRDGNAELYSRALSATGTDVRLSTTPANETDPQLSPDGLHIAYTRDDGGIPRVWIADVSNANASALTSPTASTIEGSPAWRFASDSLLFMSTSLGNASIVRASRLAGATPASTAKPTTTDSVYVEPAWSFDGTRIAFTAGSGAGASRIAVRSRATNSTIFVTPPTTSAGQPVFLADGRIVFTVFSAGGVTSLAWVDPAVPGVIHPIALTGTNPQHPAIIWP